MRGKLPHFTGHLGGSSPLPIVSVLVIVVIALATVVVSVTTAGADDASPTASPSGDGKTILRIGGTVDADNLNPFIGMETTTQEIFTLNYDYLTDFDPATLAVRPRLAESWETSADGKEWTFTVRSGVTWHDGEPFTAADVVFTFRYIIENEMGMFTGFTAGIESVEAVDDTKVKFTLSQPKANMLALMVPILPEHIWSNVDPEDAGKGYQNKPPIVGTGPFQVVEVQEGSFVRLVANKEYWGGAPHVDELILLTYSNPTSMAEELKAGVLDGASALPYASFEQFTSNPAYGTADTNPYRWVMTFGFNCYDSPASKGHPALLDPAFRHALNYAVDKEKMCEVGLYGHAQPAETLIISDYYSDPDWSWEPPVDVKYGYDPAKAEAELDAAGYTDTDGDGWREDTKGKPLKLRLYTLNYPPERETVGKMLTAELREIGLDIDFTVMDEGALIDRMWSYDGDTFTPDYDLFIWGWSGDMDPNFILSVFTTGQIENWSDSNWSSSEYDSLFEQQGQETDSAARQALIWEMQELMYRESPQIFLAYPGVMTAWNVTDWEGWVRAPAEIGHPFGTQYFADTYLNVRPAGTEEAAEGSQGVWIAVIVAAVVVVAAVVWLLRRRRPRAETEAR
jgi:peptide/nickel transport system substrate-binding protein